VFRHSGIQAFRHSGIQVFRYSGIQVFRYWERRSPYRTPSSWSEAKDLDLARTACGCGSRWRDPSFRFTPFRMTEYGSNFGARCSIAWILLLYPVSLERSACTRMGEGSQLRARVKSFVLCQPGRDLWAKSPQSTTCSHDRNCHPDGRRDLGTRQRAGVAWPSDPFTARAHRKHVPARGGTAEIPRGARNDVHEGRMRRWLQHLLPQASSQRIACVPELFPGQRKGDSCSG